MIFCRFVSHDGAKFAFDVSGHAGFAKRGKDIVCAAVSAAVDLTMHLTQDVFGVEADVTVEKAGEVSFIAKGDCRTADRLIGGLADYMEAVGKEYPRTVTIEYLEV